MKIIEKNILEVEKGIICQQVNCQGKMNSGLAKQIREKWPIVYQEYIKLSEIWNNDFQRLGQSQLIKIEENLYVLNFFGQLNYCYDGQRYTDYSALQMGFKKFATTAENHVYFPFNFGACRGGGNWEIILNMIEYYFPNAIICKLPDKIQCHIHTFTTKDKCGCK